MEQKKKQIVSIIILMLYLSFYFSVAYAGDLSIGTARVSGPIVIPIDHGGFIQQIIWFIASFTQEPKRLANVSIIIYELPYNNTVCNLTTDTNGIANTTLTPGEYRYVAHYNNQVVEGTFTQIEENTVYLQFVGATPIQLWRTGMGIVVIGSCIAGAVIANQKTRRKRRMTKARRNTEKSGRTPRLKPDSYKGRRPLAQGPKGEGYNGNRPLGRGKKGKWKFPRSEGEGYAS